MFLFTAASWLRAAARYWEVCWSDEEGCHSSRFSLRTAAENYLFDLNRAGAASSLLRHTEDGVTPVALEMEWSSKWQTV